MLWLPGNAMYHVQLHNPVFFLFFVLWATADLSILVPCDCIVLVPHVQSAREVPLVTIAQEELCPTILVNMHAHQENASIL